MGYKNNNAYVQRQMDRLLGHLEGVNCYCNDIVAASDSLEEHLNLLNRLFLLLQQKNITLNPSKSFVGFPNAVVLGRMVDAFGMSTTDERINAIKRLKFPQNLKELETFIGFTGWLRHQTPMYSILIAPLEERKTQLNKRARIKGQPKQKRNHKTWSVTVAFEEPTAKEMASFKAIKEALTRNTMVYFFIPTARLFIDFDVSRHGIGAEVYHVDESTLPKLLDEDGAVTTYPPRTAIRPIAFLSRILSNDEKKYWPTEMEVLGFVWTVKKAHHWICTTHCPPVTVFTDHGAILGLRRQADIALSTASSARTEPASDTCDGVSEQIRVSHPAQARQVSYCSGCSI